MNNIKNKLLSTRIPPFIGILFLILSIGTIGWLSSNAVLFGTRAAISNTPKNVHISNVSNTTFTVFYETSDQVTGSIQYGETQNLGQVAFDDRDKSNEPPKQYVVHHITIKNLKPSTRYFFTITSGNKNFQDENKPYEIMTTANPVLGGMKLSGKVVLDNGEAPSEAIVYITTNHSQALSTLVKNGGQYEIDMPIGKRIISLQISDSVRESEALLLPHDNTIVPLIILSKNYDFTISEEPLSPTPIASASGTVTPPVAFPNDSKPPTVQPQILSPESDQEFKDQQPLFNGTAVPGAEVVITIESEEPLIITVKASANGNWQYRPDKKLPTGDHTITIKTTDASGIVRTISQHFVVFAAGSEFVEPSVSPSVKPTTTPGLTSAPTNTPTPTTIVSPTKSSVSITPTKNITSIVSQTQIPVTGNTTLIATIVGVATAIGTGALLFFLTAL